MIRHIAFAGAALFALAQPAFAQKAPDADKADQIDLSDPANVVSAMQRAGYKALLKTGDDGEPYISSSANGGNFSVQFYDCKDGKKCGSLQFSSWWDKKDYFSIALVNEWNVKKRFLKVSLNDDGTIDERLYLTAAGTVSYENFADSLDWFVVMDADFAKFLDEKMPAGK
jgi:hypothetical protein